MISDEQLKNWFTYHAPAGDDPDKYEKIRAAAYAFAKVIRDNTLSSADQTAAIGHVRYAGMTANAAIACKGQ